MTTHPATGEALHTVSVVVNGGLRTAQVPARRLLSDFLRHDLGLTGTHVGCEHGVCGACTVLIDGAPMRSCLMFAASAPAPRSSRYLPLPLTRRGSSRRVIGAPKSLVVISHAPR